MKRSRATESIINALNALPFKWKGKAVVTLTKEQRIAIVKYRMENANNTPPNVKQEIMRIL